MYARVRFLKNSESCLTSTWQRLVPALRAHEAQGGLKYIPTEAGQLWLTYVGSELHLWTESEAIKSLVSHRPFHSVDMPGLHSSPSSPRSHTGPAPGPSSSHPTAVSVHVQTCAERWWLLSAEVAQLGAGPLGCIVQEVVAWEVPHLPVQKENRSSVRRDGI